MRDVRPAAWLLIGAVGLVLLIACANLSNLLLARSSTRQREMAVRLALGAARWRIARHLLAEVALLAIAGLGAGLLLAQVGLPALVSVVPAQLNTLGVTAAINFRVLGWAAMFAIGSAALVALLPVFQSTRTSPQDALKSDGRGATAGRVPLRLRHSLIVAEIALSVVLLVGAGLFVRSFRAAAERRAWLRSAQRADDAHHRAVGEVSRRRRQRVLPAGPRSPRTDARRARRVGGFAVSAAGRVLDGVSPGFDGDRPARRCRCRRSRRPARRTSPISGCRSSPGAAFATTDRRDAPLVAIVNQAFVAKFLPGAEALGRRVSIGPSDRPSPPMEIVGIVGQHAEPRHAEPAVAGDLRAPASADIEQSAVPAGTAGGDAGSMLPVVRQQLAAIDPDQPVYNVQTLEEAVSAANFGNRFSMVLVRDLCRGRAVADHHRHLRRDVVRGECADPGDRRAPCGWRRPPRRDVAGAETGAGADRRSGWSSAWRASRPPAARFDARSSKCSRSIRSRLARRRPSWACVALVAGWFPAWRASRVDPVDALRYE